jgi:hypothetical protein
MRFFAILCYGIALFYGYMAVEDMRKGTSTPLRGDTTVMHRKDDPNSNYGKYLAARWLLAGGFAVLGIAMRIFAAKFEALDAKK